MCKVVVLLGIFCVCLCERWNWEKDYISLLSLSLSLSQTDSHAARRQNREECVHHGHFTWHQSADSHFLTQKQPQRRFQVLPQSVHNQGMALKSSPCQQASATRRCKSTHSFCYTLTCHLSASFILTILYLDFPPPPSLRKVDIVKFVVYIIIQCFCIWPNLSINRFNVLLYMHKNIRYMNSVSGEVMHTYVHTKHTAQ